MSNERTLDIRAVPPREKHPAIFQTFAALEAGPETWRVQVRMSERSQEGSGG